MEIYESKEYFLLSKLFFLSSRTELYEKNRLSNKKLQLFIREPLTIPEYEKLLGYTKSPNRANELLNKLVGENILYPVGQKQLKNTQATKFSINFEKLKHLFFSLETTKYTYMSIRENVSKLNPEMYDNEKLVKMENLILNGN